MKHTVTVTRLDFPHPRRVKFVLDWPEPLTGEDVGGKQCWIVYRATKEKAGEIAPEVLLDWYLTAGALPGSRVTVEQIPTETVRAAEITEKHALRDKILVLAEAQATENTSFIPELSASVLDKADQLEREASASGAITEGLHIRLRKLRLRGAIGIHKGQHVDEIELDLDRFDAGLVALVGVNGAGKTTLIENMHPYRSMLTREGKLQDHFRLRDSARELTFVDERTGAEYRSLMLIDGVNATGKAEYHLFKLEGGPVGEGLVEADWIPLTNGRAEEYDQVIEKLFGTLPLFLRSAFVSQRATKSNPDLTEATKGEKKAIFRELAGLDYLQAYADSAKQKAGAIEAEIAVERGRINFIESQLTALPGICEQRKQAVADLDARKLVLADLESRGLALKKNAEALAQKVKEQEILQQRIDGLEGQAEQKRQEIQTYDGLIQLYETAVRQQPAAQKVVDDWTALKDQEGKENERIAGVSKERERITAEYGRAQKAHSDACRAIEATRSALRTQGATLEGNRNVLQAQIDHLAAELGTPLKENCPTCGQILPEQKREELRQKRALSETKLAELKQKHAKIGQELLDIGAQMAAITLPDAPFPPDLLPVDHAPLHAIRASLAVLNIDAARKSLTTAQEAATRLEETRKQKIHAEAELAGISVSLDDAKTGLDATIATTYAEAQAKLEAARHEYQEAAKTVAGLEAQIKAQEQRISELKTIERNLGERKVTVEEKAADAGEWRYLERACGPDGIQALELDAMGPGIAEVANRLLSAAYGSRFTLEFRTTRIAGKGSKTRQVEDFSIWILDSEDGSEQELSTLSGGESVWIKRALYDAFGIIRDRNTGTRFLTVFQDEADGALDPESRQHYFAMLQAAHQESARRHTIIITHSPEAQEMISQRIIMAELTKKEAVTA